MPSVPSTAAPASASVMLPSAAPTRDGPFATGIVLASAAFLLGALFTALALEQGVLYAVPSQQAYTNLEQFYLTMWTSPLAVKALLHVMLIAPLFALCFKVATYTEAAVYFDAPSALLALGTVALYTSSTVPNIRLLASTPSTPALKNLVFAHSSGAPTAFDPSSPFAFLNRLFVVLSYPSSIMSKESSLQSSEALAKYLAAEPVTDVKRKELLAVVAAGHTIMGVLLMGVLVLQFGRWYAEREQARLFAKFAIDENSVTVERKSQ